MIRIFVIRFSFFLLLLLFRSLAYAQGTIEFSFLMEFGKKGIGNGEMNQPQGISVDAQGFIYIADTGNNRIQKFSPKGEFVVLRGGFGWAEEQFDEPVSVSAKGGLDVLVSDKNNHRIARYDRNLNFISVSGIHNFADAAFNGQYPQGLTVSALRDIFIIDSEKSRVIKINSFGQPEYSFGGFGSQGITLNNPENVAVFKKDRVYVTDSEKKELVIFDYFGNYLNSYGGGMFDHPSGVDTDDVGNVYVCDSEKKTVTVFGRRGRVLAALSVPGWTAPANIAVSDNRLYILDSTDAKVSVFKIEKSK